MCILTKKEYPPKPECLGTIGIAELYTILLGLGIGGHIGVMDNEYKLTSVHETERFLKYYHDYRPYSKWYNCDSFAWVLRGKMLDWTDGEFPAGWIWASGADPEWPFPSHGFNWTITYDRKVYFFDELRVAAPRDELMEFYPVVNVDMLV